MKNNQISIFRRITSLLIVGFFTISFIIPPQYAHAQSVLNLPQPGVMVSLTPAYAPALIKGIKFFPHNPLQFDFIIDTGDSKLKDAALKKESTKLIKYFMASLTVPEDNLWVNLSPYEKDRIIPNDFGQTEMGRDMLAQDYLLKQITSSLMFPDEELGEKFWDKVYKKANALYGTSEVPVNTFNKVWIIPEKAVVHVNGDTVFVSDSHLKVMLEEDYLAMEHNSLNSEIGTDQFKKNDAEKLNDVSSSIIREIIIPELEKEVNQGENFAQLRQIYSSMILATWYKQNLKESFLGKVYVNQRKVSGVEVEDKDVKFQIYNQYLEAFKTGVYDFIREDYDEVTQEIIPRKYFSGGIVGGAVAEVLDDTDTESRFVAKGEVVSASTHFEPTLRSVDRLQRILNVIINSKENTLSEESTAADAVEFVLGQLKEGKLIEESEDSEGNIVISIKEKARSDKLGQIIDRFFINPVEGVGYKGIVFKSELTSSWQGKWLIVGFQDDLKEPGILDFEQRKAFYRKQDPNGDWRVAHNKVVEDLGVGYLIPTDIGDVERFRGERELAVGLGEWFSRKKRSIARRLNPARSRKPDLTGDDMVRVDTDMTLNYGGLNKWGLERIMIDLVQNHAPADARGTKIEVRFHLADGRTLNLHDEGVNNLKPGDIESIEIADDGIGYDYEHLKYFLTTKGSIEEAGKFGEGLKIATAAGILRGMEFEFHSRGWKARPFTEVAVLNQGHANEMETEYISFEVTANGQKDGSSTFIRNPSRDVLNTVRKLPDLVLLLRKDYKPMAKVRGVGEIVERGETVYIKGNRVTDMRSLAGIIARPSLFSYNVFDDTELNRDRDALPDTVVEKAAQAIMLNAVTPEVARIIIEHAGKKGEFFGRDYFETKLSISSYEVKDAGYKILKVWKEAFYALYGEDAILGTMETWGSGLTEDTKQAIKEGRNVIPMSDGVYNILAGSGIPTTASLYEGKQVEVKTGIALDYREKAWSVNRVLLDGVQNHLLADSGATEVKVEFMVKNNGRKWIDISEIDQYQDRQIESIRIADNGSGYDHRLLGMFHSTKRSSEQAGQWGEGIKMLAAAALRNDLGIELRSRGWGAKAVIEQREYKDANQKDIKVDFLTFDMMHLDNDEVQGSQTVFTSVTREFVNLVRQLPQKALAFDRNYRPISKTDVGEITSTSTRTIYVQGLEVQDETNDHKTLLGYNFIGVAGIIPSPDRNVLHAERLKEAVGVMMAQTDSPEALAVVIDEAIDWDEDHPEFQDVTELRSFNNKDTWQAAWGNVVSQKGWDSKKVVLATRRILTDPDAQILLRNMGYQIVFMNSNIMPIIHGFGVHYDYELLNPTFEYINMTDLTPEERKMLEFTDIIDRKLGEILNINVPPSPIDIFIKVKSTLTGEELSGWEGNWNADKKRIGIARSQLANPIEFGQTYLEELGHRLSEAGDYSREFTNFFRNALLTQIFKEEGIDVAMLGQGSSPVTDTDLAKGGIDFNPVNLNLQVEGAGLDMPLFRDIPELQGINIDGFTPFIINITPVHNLPLLFGYSKDDERDPLMVSLN